MDSNRSSAVSRHSLTSYFILAFLISWVFALPLVLSAIGAVSFSVSPYLHYAVLSGPILSALIVTTATRGVPGLKAVFASLTNFRIGATWLLIALFSPLLVFILALGFLLGSPLPDLTMLGRTASLPGLGVIPTVIIMILAAAEEEVGWRGFALPRLQASRSAFLSTILLSLVWFAWHLPMFWYRPTFATPTPMMFVGIFLGLTAGAFILTWLFNATRGSLFAVTLWHGVWSAIAASDLGDVIPALMSAIFMVWAVLIVVVFKPQDLSRNPRVTAA